MLGFVHVCPRCRGQTRPIDGRTVTQVDVDRTLLDVEASFCNLGDMLSAGGGCSLAIITRCCTAWGKFQKLLPNLTFKDISLTVRGKVCDACVHSALLHRRETWAPTAPDLQRLRRNDRSMIQWICDIKPHDEISDDLLCARLGIQEVTAALRSKHLRWYGHIVRSSSCIKSANMEVPCSRVRGRPRKTWSDCVKADMNVCSLGGIDPQNRTALRSGF